MSTTLYPPIPYPTTDQEFLLAAGATVHPFQYKTHDFSPDFLSIYARPTLTYHPWARLWHINTSHILEAIFPRYPSSSCNFIGFAACRERFLEFCLVVDGVFGGDGGEGNGKCITDWSIEAPFQRSLLKPGDINDNDYDEDEEDDNKNTDESHGKNNDSGVAMNSAESMQTQMQESTQEMKNKPKNELIRGNSNQNSNRNTKKSMKKKMHIKGSNTPRGRLGSKD
ncbi:hypothetical protein OCU04_006983 [Sclerotinia nivalis]|uniref:Uncharacterized protein n=1 Tax=Sclerotinia nivalis TaxID=352851 RepID=A0A9X0AKV5_9HELO|nr:hypothetical protein OCU04_006983 [Sclerotinia nivalis]